MKIKLSKVQWETMGKNAGWVKEAGLGQGLQNAWQGLGKSPSVLQDFKAGLGGTKINYGPLTASSSNGQPQPNQQMVKNVTQSVVNYLTNDVANSLTDSFLKNNIPLTAESIKQIQNAIQQLSIKASQLQPSQQQPQQQAVQ